MQIFTLIHYNKLSQNVISSIESDSSDDVLRTGWNGG